MQITNPFCKPATVDWRTDDQKVNAFQFSSVHISNTEHLAIESLSDCLGDLFRIPVS